jgi:hypothetical protein
MFQRPQFLHTSEETIVQCSVSVATRFLRAQASRQRASCLDPNWQRLSAIFDLAANAFGTRHRDENRPALFVFESGRVCVCVCHLLDLLLKVLSYSSLAECICGNSKRPTQYFRFDETIASSINHSC